MDNPTTGTATPEKKRRIFLNPAQEVINAEVSTEHAFHQQRKQPVLSFSQDAQECSATTPNMSSVSPKAKKRFSISGPSSPLSGSVNSSPKSIRIENTENKLNVSLEGVPEDAQSRRSKNLGSKK